MPNEKCGWAELPRCKLPTVSSLSPNNFYNNKSFEMTHSICISSSPHKHPFSLENVTLYPSSASVIYNQALFWLPHSESFLSDSSSSPHAYQTYTSWKCLFKKCFRILLVGLVQCFTHHIIPLSRVVILAHDELYHYHSLLHLQAVFGEHLCWFKSECTSVL